MNRPVGIYGGTFDPIHNAHLQAARHARDALNLAGVYLVVAADPPHRDPPWLSARQRLQLVQAAVEHETGLYADDTELKRSSPSYMVDTLSQFARRFPQSPRILILGSDALAGLPNWHQAEKLHELCHLAVLRRPGEAMPYEQQAYCGFQPAGQAETLQQQPAGKWLLLNNPLSPVSATQIRQALQRGEDIHTWVPEPVYRLLQAWHSAES